MKVLSPLGTTRATQAVKNFHIFHIKRKQTLHFYCLKDFADLMKRYKDARDVFVYLNTLC